MNSLTTTNGSGGALVTAEHAEAIRSALKSSLYPGANDASIELVLSYCKAAGLDPLTKPVHIVPMSVKTGAKDANGYDVKEMRDTIMPGIGLYRINAARTGEYAGCSAPEFGPVQRLEYFKDVWEQGANGRRQKTVKKAELVYPEWCRMTVRRVVAGTVVEFTAIEYWIENYASTRDGAPNEMWAKRPFAQLAKCTEAQALRRAFPEAVGSQPTADEMEGKHLVDVEALPRIEPPAGRPEPQPYPAADFEKNLQAWRVAIATGRKTADDIIAMVSSKGVLSEDQIKEIRACEVGPADPVDAEFIDGGESA